MTDANSNASMQHMGADSNQQAIQQRIEQLTEHMSVIRRHMEKTIAENHRLREVVRLAESELRKRRDHVHKLETEVQELQSKRLDAKGRVENAIDRLDHLIAETEQDES